MIASVKRSGLGTIAFAVSLILAAGDRAAADPPESPAPSKFAPAEDLIAQVVFYLHRTEETLAKKDEFDDAAKTRLRKDANTLTALFLTLGLHDTENQFKTAAPALLQASRSLAKAADYDAAVASFNDLKRTASGGAGASGGGKLRWERTASLSQLMKQVPAINSALKRGLSGDEERFKQLQQQSAGSSAALAAIAQTVLADTHEAKSPGDEKKWYQYCAEMRDAAGAVNAAVHAGDQQAATAAMVGLTKSCEDCHEVFRKE